MSGVPSPAVLLQAWLSPGFPTGAFAYSHALEQAHAEGEVGDAASLQAWLALHRDCGSLRNDACVVALAWHAARAEDASRLRGVNALTIALAGGAERRLELTAQGAAFARAIAAAWATPAIERTYATLAPAPPAYPVAVAVAAAGHAIELHPLLESYAFAWVANLVSAAMRLGILGQTDAQRAVASLAAGLAALAAAARQATEDDLGTGLPRAELQAVRHESLYTRLFRT